jgi:hypothetical protein
MKRKIRLSALIADMVLMLALLIGGLYGYFDDTENGAGAVFTAGTLDLEVWTSGNADCTFTPILGVQPVLNGSMQFQNMAPGNSGSVTWRMENDGTVDGNLTFNAVTASFLENGLTEPEAADGDTDNGIGELGLFVDATLTRDINGGGPSANLLGDNSTLDDLEAALNAEASALLPAGQYIEYVMTWSIDGPGVGNEIQGDSASFGLNLFLEQDY